MLYPDWTQQKIDLINFFSIKIMTTSLVYVMNNQTITITLGDQAENHAGMQKIGEAADEGFDYNDLVLTKNYLKNIGIESVLYDLGWPVDDIQPVHDAYLLHVPNFIDQLFCDGHSDDMFQELVELPWDKKALIYGRVVNKNARYNLCFGDRPQEPSYANGKGRIVAYDSVPLLSQLVTILSTIHLKCDGLVAEGNYYHDISNCGIGYHGDSERKKVIGIRLGETLPLDFQWFLNSNSIGQAMRFELSHGDIYIMSEKTVGSDWKNRSILTLRHAAGAPKYVDI